jgi:hypothetical protein
MSFLPALLLSCLLALQPAWGEELTLHIGKHAVRAEIADTAKSRELGLMGRERLCADCGMLFIFEMADRHNFWMKNTPLPLSIAFIAADGGIINIEEMQPNTTTLHGALGNALYALEMNSGWFERNEVKPDDTVKGFQPAH